MAGRAEKDLLRTAVLEDAAIVCSTLSFSGSGAFARMARAFDVVIIDEAAQAVEPSTLIPLTAGCKQARLQLSITASYVGICCMMTGFLFRVFALQLTVAVGCGGRSIWWGTLCSCRQR